MHQLVAPRGGRLRLTLEVRGEKVCARSNCLAATLSTGGSAAQRLPPEPHGPQGGDPVSTSTVRGNSGNIPTFPPRLPRDRAYFKYAKVCAWNGRSSLDGSWLEPSSIAGKEVSRFASLDLVARKAVSRERRTNPKYSGQKINPDKGLSTIRTVRRADERTQFTGRGARSSWVAMGPGPLSFAG